MRRILLLVGGGLTIAGALLPWVELQVTGLPISVDLDMAKHGVGILAVLAGCLALFAALLDDGAPVSILASAAAAGAAAFSTYRIIHSAGYDLAAQTGIVHWSPGLGLWAMGLGAVSALAALFTAHD
jgi:hypothetical protein